MFVKAEYCEGGRGWGVGVMLILFDRFAHLTQHFLISASGNFYTLLELFENCCHFLKI
jgi:hypothetical protein